jgi:molybdate transport system regulatory protein
VELSTRNQLPGTVKSVEIGTVMAEVVVDVAGLEIVAAITRRSAERLELAEGQSVVVLVKATEVTIGRE